MRGNDNGVSGSNKKGDISVFPHAYANRVTDNKREFEPRNAIDGFEFNASHVGFHIKHGVVEMKRQIQNFLFYLDVTLKLIKLISQ